MKTHELVVEMKLLERRMTLYEEKYGILSEDFYSALMEGKLAEYDAHDETRADFSRWKGIYQTWLRRKSAGASTRPISCSVPPKAGAMYAASQSTNSP